MLAYRIMMVNFTAIHTTSFTVTNLLFDLLGSPRVSEFFAGLREEAERISRGHNGVWSKAAVANAVRLDSAIRETMRLSSFLGRGLERKVVSKEGLTLDDGCRIPQGAKIGVSVYSIHHDEGLYSQAYEYDAFRFSRPLEDAIASCLARGEEHTSSSAPKRDDLDSSQGKLESLVTTSERFLSFGHGRHAWYVVCSRPIGVYEGLSCSDYNCSIPVPVGSLLQTS